MAGCIRWSVHRISIHALREEGDQVQQTEQPKPEEFLSTPSMRRATRVIGSNHIIVMISIHALHEEGDRNFINCRFHDMDFYPRPP